MTSSLDGSLSAARRAGTGALLLFWDYDTQWGADRSRIPGGGKNWGPLEFPNTDRLLEIHAQYGVAACFAVVGSAALPGKRPYHDPEQVRRIHALGHEVASHSLRHDWLPGLNRSELRESLQVSREALEQCIGGAVRSFVPPFNQPFDFPARLSISLSERRTGSVERLGIEGLCKMLGETGYNFCRVYYRTAWRRLQKALLNKHLDAPSRAERIAGLHCVRLNTPCGFIEPTMRMLERCATEGGLAIVYGHPHSITVDGWQNERHLLEFFERVRVLRREGRIEVLLPRDLVAREQQP